MRARGDAVLAELVRELPALALDERGRLKLAALVELLARDPSAPTSVREESEAWRVHIADSLSGLAFDELATAKRIADLGAGAGFPGLVLAAALPESQVDLIEAARRKCEFAVTAIGHAGTDNARVVCERSETHAAAAGREAYDAVTARAVGRLATLAELASPLLQAGGAMIAWKGRRDPSEESELIRAEPRTGMSAERVLPVGPYAGSRHRHLHLVVKTGPTPADLPRRPGVAKKRPFGSS